MFSYRAGRTIRVELQKVGRLKRSSAAEWVHTYLDWVVLFTGILRYLFLLGIGESLSD